MPLCYVPSGFRLKKQEKKFDVSSFQEAPEMPYPPTITATYGNDHPISTRNPIFFWEGGFRP